MITQNTRYGFLVVERASRHQWRAIIFKNGHRLATAYAPSPIEAGEEAIARARRQHSMFRPRYEA